MPKFARLNVRLFVYGLTTLVTVALTTLSWEVACLSLALSLAVIGYFEGSFASDARATKWLVLKDEQIKKLSEIVREKNERIDSLAESLGRRDGVYRSCQAMLVSAWAETMATPRGVRCDVAYLKDETVACLMKGELIERADLTLDPNETLSNLQEALDRLLDLASESTTIWERLEEERDSL